MNKKLMLLISSMVVSVAILSGCASQTAKPAAAATTTTTAAKTDTVSGASMATNEASFEQKIGKDGNYIILVNKDLTFTKVLTVEGTFTKKDKNGKDVVVRALALATRVPNSKNVDKSFTLTVPNLIIKSENADIEDGTVKGDVYVQAPGFITEGATIDGNLYFANDGLKNAFKLEAKSKVTGQIAVKAYSAK